jgi:hypothetical protein
MVGAGAHDGPSPIDQNMLSDLCFFGASKAPPPTDSFLKPTDKPKFEIPPKGEEYGKQQQISHRGIHRGASQEAAEEGRQAHYQGSDER